MKEAHLNPKYFLITVSVLILGTAQAKATVEILRSSDDGEILLMTHFQASGVNPETKKQEKPNICEELGKGRLLTIRELAKESEARGAKGILEVNQVNPDEVPAGYYMISATNPDGQKDEFYYNHEGYQSPDDATRYNAFWSSSIDSNYYYPHLAYAFDGYSGGISSFGRDYYNYLAVLCVSGGHLTP